MATRDYFYAYEVMGIDLRGTIQRLATFSSRKNAQAWIERYDNDEYWQHLWINQIYVFVKLPF